MLIHSTLLRQDFSHTGQPQQLREQWLVPAVGLKDCKYVSVLRPDFSMYEACLYVCGIGSLPSEQKVDLFHLSSLPQPKNTHLQFGGENIYLLRATHDPAQPEVHFCVAKPQSKPDKPNNVYLAKSEAKKGSVPINATHLHCFYQATPYKFMLIDGSYLKACDFTKNSMFASENLRLGTISQSCLVYVGNGYDYLLLLYSAEKNTIYRYQLTLAGQSLKINKMSPELSLQGIVDQGDEVIKLKVVVDHETKRQLLMLLTKGKQLRLLEHKPGGLSEPSESEPLVKKYEFNRAYDADFFFDPHLNQAHLVMFAAVGAASAAARG